MQVLLTCFKNWCSIHFSPTLGESNTANISLHWGIALGNCFQKVEINYKDMFFFSATLNFA